MPLYVVIGLAVYALLSFFEVALMLLDVAFFPATWSDSDLLRFMRIPILVIAVCLIVFGALRLRFFAIVVGLVQIFLSPLTYIGMTWLFSLNGTIEMSLELPNWYFDHVALIFGAALVCLHFLAPVRAPTATVCEEPDESGASLVIAENLDVHPDPAVIAAAPFDSRTEVQQRERD